VTILFDEKTKFVKIDEKGSSDVKSDDLSGAKRVSVVYESKGGKNLATKVTIIDLPKKKKT